MDANISYRTQTSISSFNQLPTFTTANKLLLDKFRIDLTKFNKNKNHIIELSIGDKICIVKPSSNLVCDTIVRGILPKRHGGLESPTVYVLITDNKFDFYNITDIANNQYQILNRVLENVIVKRIFTIYQLADFLIRDLGKDIKKYKSKLFIITGDFFLRDEQISNHDKDWLYPQMIKAITKVKDSVILVFSPIKLKGLVNYK
ncbi:MAG TPA: hypothetical protein VJ697_15900 [Nitrososphaeraceae archaeon]|nr:hypothetical protein [Nitrososphaeraceae archaeon]